MSQIPGTGPGTDPQPSEDTAKKLSRLTYEVGALWQRVRNLKRDKSDTGHTHPMDGVSSRAAKVYLGSNQSISNNTNTKVALDTAAFDPDGLFDSANNQIVLDKLGMWAVVAQVRYAVNSTGNLRQCRIQREGSAKSIVRIGPSGGLLVVSAAVVVQAGSTSDVVELFAQQDSGGALDVASGRPWTFLSVAYLGS